MISVHCNGSVHTKDSPGTDPWAIVDIIALSRK
jgi:hypothetical protein